MITIDMDAMVQELESDEGVVPYAYQDSMGFWTIGVGHLVDKRKGAGLDQDVIDHQLQNDITRALQDIQGEPWFLACDTDPRRRALVNMRFQLGSLGIRQFKVSLGLIAQKKWSDAAVNLRKSLWYQQTPNRAERVIRMIENG